MHAQMARPLSGGASPPRPYFSGSETYPVPMLVDGQGHTTDRQGTYIVANLHKTTIIRAAGELLGSKVHPDDVRYDCVCFCRSAQEIDHP